MTGKIKKSIEEIITIRSKGNATIASTTKAKLIIKGLNPDQYSENTPDDPVILEKVAKIAAELGIAISI